MTSTTYLTTAELAARWRLTSGHLRNLRTKGRGPRWTRPAHAVPYELASVEEFETSGAPPTSCAGCHQLRHQAEQHQGDQRRLRARVAELEAADRHHRKMGRTLIAQLDEALAALGRPRA